MIHILDYGVGNIQAFINMYKRLDVPTIRVRDAADLVEVKKLILPGVGAFDHAMTLFEGSGLRSRVTELVKVEKIPVLGICVGMQMLANTSDEGRLAGLGWVPGRVKRLNAQAPAAQLPMPHMGWNDVVPATISPIFKGVGADARFYFLHSYYFECVRPEHSVAKSEYGFEFDCAVQNENIFGVQFHPEKSHHWGAQLLKNFADI